MTTHLDPVLSSSQISAVVSQFNNEAVENGERTRRLVTGTTYWVYDSNTENFGPSKFVGFADMNFEKYEVAISGNWTGAQFNGAFTRERIEKVLGKPYQQNDSLEEKLLDWADDLGHNNIFDGVDTKKLKFLEILRDETVADTEVRPLEMYSTYSRCEVRDIFAPDAPCQPQRGAWGLHGIVSIPDRPGDYAFFVTFGQSQAGHDFDESITEEGVLSWQSQPSQNLQNKRISHFINHDELQNSIYLFLRPKRDLPYTFLGKLKYLDHDTTRERPVYFRWQIMDWDSDKVPTDEMGLELSESGTPHSLPSTAVAAGLSMTEPPKPKKRGSRTRSFSATKGINYSGNDASNKRLGLAGEKLVVRYEQETLFEAGRSDLAQKVVHVSADEGDGAGYDVRSYTIEGDQKYIEVKTTTTGPNTQFFISPNELAFSAQHPDEFYLYRVYSFNSQENSGKSYVLHGDVANKLDLSPTEYRAGLRGDLDSEPSNI
jgi:hypothetical protein